MANQQSRLIPALMTCGILAAVTYVATDLVAGLTYAGYSFADQAVSELFAIGAPTSRIVVPLFTISSVLVAMCAFGVWRCADHIRSLQWAAVMLFGNAANSLVLWNFFPMHMRGVTPTFTDAMHGLLAINPFVLLTVVLGTAAFKGWFRAYSVVTVLVMLVAAVLSFSTLAAFVAHQPTPGMGLTERTSQYAYQLWQGVFALVLLRRWRRNCSFGTPQDRTAHLAA